LHSELVRILHEVSNPFPLEEWIDSRLGNKIEISRGPNGMTIRGDANYVLEVASIADATSAVPDESSLSQRDFLASLPNDVLTAEEGALRDAIYDCLASSGRDEITLNDIAQDQIIHQKRMELVEANGGASTWKQMGCCVDRWVNHRIGKEMVFRGKLEKKKLVLTPEGLKYLHARRKTVSSMQTDSKQVAEVMDPFPFAIDTASKRKNLLRARQKTVSSIQTDSKQVAEDMEVPFPFANDTASKEKNLFERLPANEFTEAELALREAVYNYLNSLDYEGDVPLPDVSADNLVQEKRKELAAENDCTNLKKIGLYDWIKKRLVDEMQIVQSRKPWTLKLTDAGRTEKFLASLPTESFTEDEVQLRSVLIYTVDNWDSGTPFLSIIKGRPDVLAHIKAVLPAGCPVSLEEWIKCRIDSDIRIRDGALERVTRGTKRHRTNDGSE